MSSPYQAAGGSTQTVPKRVAISRSRAPFAPKGFSAPGFNATVLRPARAVVRGLDREGREQRIEATGLLARAFQHEIDHLDGRLFVDRLRGIRRDVIVRKVQRMQRSGKW